MISLSSHHHHTSNNTSHSSSCVISYKLLLSWKWCLIWLILPSVTIDHHQSPSVMKRVVALAPIQPIALCLYNSTKRLAAPPLRPSLICLTSFSIYILILWVSKYWGCDCVFALVLYLIHLMSLVHPVQTFTIVVGIVPLLQLKMYLHPFMCMLLQTFNSCNWFSL